METNPFRACQDCLCFAARRAARAITQAYDHQLRPSGLRATQFALLAFLITSGPAPVQQTADFLGMDRTTLTRNLKPLTQKGLVHLQSGKDRRVKIVAITADGRRKAEQALPLWRIAQKHARAHPPAFGFSNA